MDTYSLDQLDMLMNDAACNIVLKIQRDGTSIALSDFNPKNKRHLGVFHVACLISNTMNTAIIVDLPYWRFKFFKWKVKHKELFRGSSPFSINVGMFGKSLEDGRNMPGGFEQIYETYGKKGKKR